jgi:hypothetical protein
LKNQKHDTSNLDTALNLSHRQAVVQIVIELKLGQAGLEAAALFGNGTMKVVRSRATLRDKYICLQQSHPGRLVQI